MHAKFQQGTAETRALIQTSCCVLKGSRSLCRYAATTAKNEKANQCGNQSGKDWILFQAHLDHDEGEMMLHKE